MEPRRVFLWSRNSPTHLFFEPAHYSICSIPKLSSIPIIWGWTRSRVVAFPLPSLRYKSIHKFSSFQISEHSRYYKLKFLKKMWRPIIAHYLLIDISLLWSWLVYFNASFVCIFVHNNDIFHIFGTCMIPSDFASRVIKKFDDFVLHRKGNKIYKNYNSYF